MKKIVISIAACLCCAALSAADRDVDAYVYNKYSGLSGGSQASWGALNCHDPKLFQDDDGTYYVYSTDASIGNVHKNGLQVRSSKDLVHWECSAKSALQDNWDRDFLAWVGQNSGSATTWAPTVIKQNGLYYMLHGVITDTITPGQPSACITLAVASRPAGPFYPAVSAAEKDPVIAAELTALGVTYTQSALVRYAWSSPQTKNTASYKTEEAEDSGSASWNGGFGAIDPEFVSDISDGSLKTFRIGRSDCYAVTYGSWKGGIALMYVDSVSLKPVDAGGRELDVPADTVDGAFGTLIAGGGGAAFEGAQVIYNREAGYYYIFVSMGDLNNDYRVGVGRSKSIPGPYLDASGNDMKFTMPGLASAYHAYGSKIIGAAAFNNELSWRCPGGESILRSKDGKILFACHTRTNFLPGYYFYLQIHQLFFTSDGWPMLNQNEYYNDYNGTDERLAPLTTEEIAGTYDAILTSRGSGTCTCTPYGGSSVQCNSFDGIPAGSAEMILGSDGTISGKKYGGTWNVSTDGYTVTIVLTKADGKKLGTFTGYILRATDWARKGRGPRKTITFTTIDANNDANGGEYFFGNQQPSRK
jgi:arabinan endo-1,5-alpha-L-arabinosidase